jgi:hypothetical protein
VVVATLEARCMLSWKVSLTWMLKGYVSYPSVKALVGPRQVEVDSKI